MRITLIVTLAILISVGNCLSQEFSELEKSNRDWSRENKNKSVNEQILEIKARLAKDTASSYIDGKTFISLSSHALPSRVLMIINNKIYIISDGSAKMLIRDLNPSMIKSLQILDGDESTMLYGRSSGAVLIETKKTLFKKRAKKPKSDSN